jgi:predicted ATPase
MVRELEVEGYRSIRSLRLPMQCINVLVGPNGSGKTNLYRAMYLLWAAANGTLSRTLADEGGMPSVLWAGPYEEGPVRMRIGVTLDELAYSLSCGLVPPVPGESGLFARDPEVKEEHVWVLEGKRRHELLKRKDRTAFVRDAEGKRVTFPATLWSGESVLAQLSEPHRFPVLSALRMELGSWRFYHHFRTDAESPVRQPQVGIRTPVLSHDGQDLAAALQTILDVGDERGLLRGVDRAFPGAGLEIIAPEGRFSVRMRMPGLRRPLEARELSDGTLRYLCLLAALLSPRPPAFLALNEPETSLHPDLLEPLADLCVQASKQSQVWITTHSEPFARSIERQSGFPVVRLAKPAGETQVEGAPGRRCDEDDDDDDED